MQLIPAMDLIDNQVVRLEQGDYNRVTVFSSEPIKVAQQFRQAGLSRLHVVDLSGAKAGQPQHSHLAGQIKAKVNMSIEVGGGIRKLEDIDLLIENGLSKKEDFFMIGSLPFKNKAEFSRIKEKYVKNILLTVDVWGEQIRISGWQEETNSNVFDFIKEQTDQGISRFLVTQIKKDGMMAGPDFELYANILQRCGNIELIASGGVSSIEDLHQLKEIDNLYGAIVGKAFYTDAITIEQLRNFR